MYSYGVAGVGFMELQTFYILVLPTQWPDEGYKLDTSLREHIFFLLRQNFMPHHILITQSRELSLGRVEVDEWSFFDNSYESSWVTRKAKITASTETYPWEAIGTWDTSDGRWSFEKNMDFRVLCKREFGLRFHDDQGPFFVSCLK